jgi:CheY-like chemotaxis protein
MRDVLRSLLNQAGYTAITAAGGEEALNLAAHLDAAIVILDLAMPNGDGVYTCRALRQMEAWRDVPILILTSHHTDKAFQAARQAGAAGFVCKPFIPSQLLQRVAALTGQGNLVAAAAPMVWADRSARTEARGDARPDVIVWERAAPGQQDEQFSVERAVLQAYRSIDPANGPAPARLAPPQERAKPRHFHLLVAEDEELTQEIVVHILSQEEYLVDHVDNGQEALAAVIRGQYDLVLMDVNMPGLNGIEAARTIRSLPNHKARVPIVAMTANAFQQYAEEMRAAGMNGYLMKPINPSALLNCVQEHLGRAPQRASCRRDGQSQTLDLDLLKDEARHFAPGAIGRFMGNLAVSINEVLPVVQGWISADPVEVKRHLHNLAGVAGTLGCTRLSEAARALEKAPLNDELVEQFVDTAHASVAVIEQYLGRGSGSAIRVGK